MEFKGDFLFLFGAGADGEIFYRFLWDIRFKRVIEF